MNNEIQFLLYNSPEGGENVQVLVKDETIWMTQKAISQLFDCTVDNVGLHLRNIFKEGELSEISRGCVKIDTSSFCSSFTLSTT